MTKGTTKSQGQKHAADKFYTKPEIAQLCLASIPGGVEQYTLSIEPSAGSGSFSSLIPGSLALDLHPEAEGIVEQDWFTYSRERSEDPQEKVLVFGNPPFGQQNSLAVRFINHAATFADTVAFVLPLSFKKDSVQDRLNKHLHLVLELELPKKAFTLHGEDYGVPCVFQVWEYDASRVREKSVKVLPVGFSFVKKEDSPHMSVQRVGGRAGLASVDYVQKSVQSNYFLKFDPVLDSDGLKKVADGINDATFASRDHSVGPRSISKTDVALVVNDLLM
jgi:hypothetical protein